MRTIFAVVLTLFLTAAPQQGSIAGKWDITAAAASKRRDDGGSVSRSAQRFVLDLSVDGAKATATLTPKGGPGSPWSLSGTWQQAKLELTSAWRDIPVKKNGKDATAKARYLVRLTQSGDTFSGACEFSMEDSEPLPQPCTAQRAK